jgi:TonB family protein
VNGPVTFGFVSPAVLLPEYFDEIGEAQQSAAVCHELAHVRRNDAVTVFAEEVLRSVLWFHPLVWWLLDRIQLCREQVVDSETIAITGDRVSYLETLLEFAQRTALPDLAPATPFLKRNHLVERMTSIAKEVNMTDRIKRLNAVALYTLMPCALALGIWLLPLRGQAQMAADTPGVTVSTPFEVLHRPPVELPNEVIAGKIRGAVVVSLSVDERGEVTDARVASGPAEMQRAVLQSIREWHFDTQHGMPPKQFEVSVRFDPLPNAAGQGNLPEWKSSFTIGRIDVSALPQEKQADVLARLPLREGASVGLNAPGDFINAMSVEGTALTLNWKDSQVELTYKPSDPVPQSSPFAGDPRALVKVVRIDVDAIPEPRREQIRETFGIREGDLVTNEQLNERIAAIMQMGQLSMYMNSRGMDRSAGRNHPEVEVGFSERNGRLPQIATLEALKVTRIDASALPEDLRARALELVGIKVGDSTSQAEAAQKLRSLNTAEPKFQFSWRPGASGTVEIYLEPRDARSRWFMTAGSSALPPSSLRITSIDSSALPEPLRQRVLERLNIHEGETLTLPELQSREAAIQEIDRHLGFGPIPGAPDGAPYDPQNYRLMLGFHSASSLGVPSNPTVRFAPAGPQPINTVTPVYPPLAIQARIQGTVRFSVIIGADGNIKNIQLISGHPLMVPSATEAVKQFRFEPGGADVKTGASVHYTFSQ